MKKILSFCCSVFTASFSYGSEQSKMYKTVHMSDFCLYTDSHVASNSEGLLPVLWWLYGEENGYPDEENGLDRPQIWGGFFFCMFIMNCTHPRQEMILCVCVCVYTSPGFSFKVNVYCDSLFPHTPPNFSVLSFKDCRVCLSRLTSLNFLNFLHHHLNRLTLKLNFIKLPCYLFI